MTSRKAGLAPVISTKSRVLILGSLPGDISLQKQQYYGNPRNHFWDILSGVFECTLSTDYRERLDFVLDRRLALWDVIESADRQGSLDANIKQPTPNDFRTLFGNYPNISFIALNGGKAARSFNAVCREHPDLLANRVYVELPSSSGIPGKNVLSLREKIEHWRKIKDYQSPQTLR